MDILDLIQDDHRKVEEYLDQLESTSGDDVEERQAVFHDLRNILEAHTNAEERVLYQRLEDESDMEDLIAQSYEDHAVVSELLQSLSEMEFNNEEWMGKFQSLRESIERHVENEEDVVLPFAERIIPDEEREEMADDMRSLEDEIVSTGPEVIQASPSHTTFGSNI